MITTKAQRHKEAFKIGLASLRHRGYFIKASILILLFLVYGFNSEGQVSFGVKAGINVSNVAYGGAISTVSSGFIDTETLLGAHFGVYGKIILSRNLSVIPEFQFAQRGYKGLTGNTKEIVNINYFELPVLCSYSVSKLIGIDLGASPSFLTSASTPFFGGFKNFDLNAIGGLRFNLTQRLFLTGRYYYGLVSVGDIEIRNINGIVSTITTFNRILQFSIGYRIK